MARASIDIHARTGPLAAALRSIADLPEAERLDALRTLDVPFVVTAGGRRLAERLVWRDEEPTGSAWRVDYPGGRGWLVLV